MNLKEKTVIVLILILYLCLVGFMAYPESDNYAERNGHNWLASPKEHKVMYVAGFTMGAYSTLVLIMAHSHSISPDLIDLLSFHRHTFVELVRRLDAYYADPSHLSLPVHIALYIVNMEEPKDEDSPLYRHDGL